MSVKRQNSKRWLVEVKRDVFEDVGADRVQVTYGGALVFTSGHVFDPQVVVIYAPGSWLTVTEEDEA